MRDVGGDEVDRKIGGAGLYAGLVEGLRHKVDAGDLPAVLRKVDRRVAGTASEVEGRSRGKGRFVTGSLDHVLQVLRDRMTVPRGKADPVEDSKQGLFGRHTAT